MKRPQGPRNAPHDAEVPSPQRHGRSTDGMALGAVVAGVAATVALWFPLVESVSLVLGVFALVFGVMSWLRLARQPARGRKWIATAGVVLGVIALVVGVSRVDQTIIEFDEDQLERRP